MITFSLFDDGPIRTNKLNSLSADVEAGGGGGGGTSSVYAESTNSGSFGTLNAVVSGANTLCTVSRGSYNNLLMVEWSGQGQPGDAIVETNKASGQFTLLGIQLGAGEFINVIYT